MTVKVTGLADIDKRFNALTGPKQRAYLRKGARAAGSLLIKETKPRIPDRKTRDEHGKLGGLKRSMKQIPSSQWKNAGSLRSQGIVGTKVGFKRGGSHAHLVEFGHKVGLPAGYKRRKNSRRFVSPKPFMRPAADAAEGRMKDAFRQKIIDGIRANTK